MNIYLKYDYILPILLENHFLTPNIIMAVYAVIEWLKGANC